MSDDDFGALASAILSDNRLCHHLRAAPDDAEFWHRLESLALERGVHLDFDALRASAANAFTFWLMHWSGGGIG